jgi:hypothetical protein
MLRSNNTTGHLFVKISAPFRLDADQRKIFVDGTFVNVAAPAGRQDGDYPYCASVTALRESNALYTTAPIWASVDVERAVAARPGRRDA